MGTLRNFQKPQPSHEKSQLSEIFVCHHVPILETAFEDYID